MSSADRGLVLITGAAGFVGHHLVMEAVKAGFTVRATDVSSRHYGALFEALDVEFIAADLTKRQGLDQLVSGVEGVFHVAGLLDYSTPDKPMFAVNVDAVENICDAAVKAGVKRLIHWSSVNVYGFGMHTKAPVNEDSEKLTPPLNNYNVSKWEGEKVIRKYIKEAGLRATIIRPAAVYGIRAEYGLYEAFARVYQDRNKKKLLMLGKGDKTDAFIHVLDLCRAAIHLYGDDSTIGEAYTISDDSSITTIEFFRLISREVIGTEKDFLFLPLKVLVPVAVISQFLARVFGGKPFLERPVLEYFACEKIFDNSKLKSTGFEFTYPTAEKGLKETISWYKENGWLRG